MSSGGSTKGRASPWAPTAGSPVTPSRAGDNRTAEPREGGRVSLRLVRGFELRIDDDLVALPYYSQRVVAFLAIGDRPQLRSSVAFSLWSDTTEARARANLRTALWKMRAGLIDVRGGYLAIADRVRVDLHQLVALTRRLIAPNGALQPGDVSADDLSGDLLPEWDEDWLHFERERLRQLRLHGLEALAERLSAEGRHAEAIDAAQAAVAAEPLRESAQRILMRAHLAESNVSEARRQFESYRVLLWESVGHSPSAELLHLLSEHTLRPEGNGMDVSTKR